jgi:hypothetical protein
MTPRLLKCAIALLQVTAVFLLSAPGVAQTIMLTDRLTRQNGLRPDEQKPYWVNYQDCVSDDVLFFDIGLSGAFGSLQLEVWASTGSGGDCSLLEERTGTSPDCWQVALLDPSLDATPRVEIRAQDIVAQNRDDDSPHGPGSGTASDCDRPEVIVPQEITLYFMFTDGREIVGTPAIYGVEPLQDIGFDVTGPRPPTEVSAGIGENRVILEWTPQPSDDLIGYNFYCDPPRAGTASTVTEAGAPLPVLDSGTPPPVTAPDATTPMTDGAAPVDAATATATDGGTETPTMNPECPSSAVVAGERPDPAHFCGSTRSAFAASGAATGLSNGTGYAVAVAGVDEIGNVGELSEVVCGSPEVVDDFFELYRRSGGKGGGGFCSVGGLVAGRDGAAAPWAALLLAGLAWAARSRLRSPPCGRTDRRRRAR